jgi:hypothetical protein
LESCLGLPCPLSPALSLAAVDEVGSMTWVIEASEDMKLEAAMKCRVGDGLGFSDRVFGFSCGAAIGARTFLT